MWQAALVSRAVQSPTPTPIGTASTLRALVRVSFTLSMLPLPPSPIERVAHNSAESNNPHYIGSVRTTWTALLAMVGVATGIASGFWMASATYPCPAFCLYAQPRFAIWQSCLVGGAAAATVLIVAGALDREFVRGRVQGIRNVSRFLFEEVSHRQVR